MDSEACVLSIRVTGIFPTNLKIVNVIPIFKKDDKISCKNCRPILFFASISKIIEGLIDSRLMKFLNANEVLYKDSLVLDIIIQQLMLFQKLLKQLDKLVSREIRLMMYHLI